VDFIDRLAGFLRGIFRDDGASPAGSPGGKNPGYQDPDLRDAWEELDDYMRGGSGEHRQDAGSTGSRQGSQRAGRDDGRESRVRPAADDSLRQDYANLEVPFGADIETVRKSYKTLILRYHPDKHAGDPEKQRIALEITKKINQSFEKIRSRHEG
jgi:DnaJ-domain-containing protein 1